MINDNYQQSKIFIKLNLFLLFLFFFRMYQLEKDDGSEFSAAIVHGGPSPSKTSLTAQQLVRKKQQQTFYDN